LEQVASAAFSRKWFDFAAAFDPMEIPKKHA
jgi:hypothetical protein